MSTKTKFVIGLVSAGVLDILLAPPEVQLAIVSVECLIPAILATRFFIKVGKEYHANNEAYYAVNPSERPSVKKAKKKAEKEFNKKRESTGDAALSVDMKRTNIGVIPVLTRRTRNNGQMIFNETTRSWMSPNRFSEWMDENKKTTKD